MKIETEYPIAFDSPDHLIPEGTKNDNSTNPYFIKDVERYFNRKVRALDLGCSGGQLIRDFITEGHVAIGLEGSDYSIKHQRANWPELHNKALFTCDISRPFKVLDDNTPVQFDCISAWEVIEHIHPTRLDQFFTNITNHMHESSIFVGSIFLGHSVHDVWHQSALSAQEWTPILERFFKPLPQCPIANWVRNYGPNTKLICVNKK